MGRYPLCISMSCVEGSNRTAARSSYDPCPGAVIRAQVSPGRRGHIPSSLHLTTQLFFSIPFLVSLAATLANAGRLPHRRSPRCSSVRTPPNRPPREGFRLLAVWTFLVSSASLHHRVPSPLYRRPEPRWSVAGWWSGAAAAVRDWFQGVIWGADSVEALQTVHVPDPEQAGCSGR